MEVEQQVTQQGDQANQEQQNQESLGWRAALPAEFKEDAYVKTFTKPGDFVKSALEIKAEHDSLKTKMDGAIFKPDEKATPEQWADYYKALGKPEQPTEYEFPVTEGINRDPKFVEWAQKTFHEIGLPKEMGQKVAAQYDAFTLAMEKANQEAVARSRADAETAIKTELGAEYPVAVELTTRMLSKYMKPEEKAFFDETGLGNHPLLIRMIFDFAKKTGEDVSIRGSNNSGNQSPSARDFYKGTGGK